MMDIGLLEALATTRAIRRYSEEEIPDEEVATMLWYAARAPSGSNRQPFRFIVITQRAHAVRSLLGEAYRRSWAIKRNADGYRASRFADSMQWFVDHLEDVPLIVLVGLERYRPANPYEGASVYPACQNLLLAARGLGYGGALSMWHLTVEDEIREALAIPVEVALAACVTIGRPLGAHGPLRRRPLGEIVSVDRWGEHPDWSMIDDALTAEHAVR